MVTNNRPQTVWRQSIDEWQKFTGEIRQMSSHVEVFLQEQYLIKNGSGSNDPLHAACGFD